MKVTVIIPTMPKNRSYLDLCVDSLKATTDWEIITAWNGEDTNRPQGQCRATNEAAKNVDADYIMVSNDDMYYAPGWNKNLRFDHLCLSPNLVEPTNNAGSAPPFLKCDGGFTLSEFKPAVVDKFIKDNVDEDKTETTGFNLPFFIRKDVWDTIGGYDEAYDPWGSNSDTDLQTKIELAGIQPMRLRDVLVYHFSNKSGTFDGTHQDAWQKNWDYYTEKWGFNRDDEPKPDVWMATDLVNKEKNIYHPSWEGKYAQN